MVCMTATIGPSPSVSGTNRKWYSEVVANWTRARSTVETASVLMVPGDRTRAPANPNHPKWMRSAVGLVRETIASVSEGLSATDVGKEIGQHAKHRGAGDGKDRALSIGEAVLLSIVTIVAAWSGYSAAQWGTESSLALAQASATRTKANRFFQESVTFRAADASSFNAWFTAYIADDEKAMEVAERRFRPEYRV